MMFFYSAHDRGHYTAYTRYGGTSLWYKYDDTKVTEVTSRFSKIEVKKSNYYRILDLKLMNLIREYGLRYLTANTRKDRVE